MYSYNHDAEVIVYNYAFRDSDVVIPSLKNFPSPQVTTTEEVKIGYAATSITCTKSKSSPYGTFSITLKPTEDWITKIVPGSWCAIFMSNDKLTKDTINNSAAADGDNFLAPLKMVGLIMAVRVNKSISQEGVVSITYTISGFDFGYTLTSSIYVNQMFQGQALAGAYVSSWSSLSFPNDDSTIGDPALNISRVLQGWSKISKEGIKAGLSVDIKPPDIRIVIPDQVAKLLGTETEIIGFMNTAIGLDQRKSKLVTIEGSAAKNFKTPLVGEKYFEPHRLILNNTVWGMINEYVNPTLNEAYCDLHICTAEPNIASFAQVAKNLGVAAPGVGKVQPLFVMRQIPFSTPNYESTNSLIALENTPSAKSEPYPITMLTDLPKTIIPSHKVINYDIGFSEYDRVNFTELNAFELNAQNKGMGINTNNKPSNQEGSIKRFGLRPKIVYGADYGFSATDKLNTASTWRGLLRDWFFDTHRYVNGTVECIGLTEHIAIGENIVLQQEEILGHIESYTHTFSVDPETGLKTFRTSIEFVRGISSKSNSKEFIPVFGNSAFSMSIKGVSLSMSASGEKPVESVFEDDMKRSTFHPSKLTDK